MPDALLKLTNRVMTIVHMLNHDAMAMYPDTGMVNWYISCGINKHKDQDKHLLTLTAGLMVRQLLIWEIVN